MTELIKTDQIPVPDKISLNDLDFDELDESELIMIKNEIEVVLKINQLKNERMNQIKKQIADEKKQLRDEMLKEIKREKDKLTKALKEKMKSEESEDEESIESIVYDKKNPKGKVNRRSTTKKK